MRASETILFGSIKANIVAIQLLLSIPLLIFSINRYGASDARSVLLIVAISLVLVSELWFASKKKRKGYLVEHFYFFGFLGCSVFVGFYPSWMYQQTFVLDSLMLETWTPTKQLYQQLALAILGMISICCMSTYFFTNKNGKET